jgi:lysylphosphatidylglycerol synthetase-like protein (DUF2156 family)
MNEKELIQTWNEQRNNLVKSQFVSVVIIGIALVLLATGQFTNASDQVKLFALAAVGTTGILSLISQLAIVREASMVVKDLAGATTNTGKIIAASGSYVGLTQAVMVIFGIAIFALLALAIY